MGSRRILDIEDLLQTGENGRGPCPYYLSRELGHTADLVLVPYNYVLDPRLRAGLAVEWKNCVMIFDEAHNIEDVCADAASVDCDPMMLPGWHSEISASLEPLLNQREQGNAEVDGPIEDRQFLKGLVLKLEGHVKNVAKNVGEAGRTYAGHHIYELLEGSGIKADETTLHLVLGQVRSAMEDLATARGTTLGKSGAAGAPNFRLQTLETLLRRILDSMEPIALDALSLAPPGLARWLHGVQYAPEKCLECLQAKVGRASSARLAQRGAPGSGQIFHS